MENEKVTIMLANNNLHIPDTKSFMIHMQPDYNNTEKDDAFWVDLYCEILKEHQVLLMLETFVKKTPRKRLLRPDRPMEYFHNERVEIFCDYMKRENTDWKWCEKTIPSVYPTMKYPPKVFFILASIVDPKLVSINYNENKPETWFWGYTTQQISDDFDTFVHQAYTNEITPAITTVESQIFINENYYPESLLIERIAKITEKHHKVLEVNV